MEALQTALDHIEHMAAWISKNNPGARYSFESLGEDMPGMRAALVASQSPSGEVLETIKQWQDWAFKWSGSAFVADEAISPEDMTETEHKAELYSDLCKLGNHMNWLYDQVAALSTAPATADEWPVYRLLTGGLHRQDVPGGRWEPLDLIDANALLERLDGIT